MHYAEHPEGEQLEEKYIAAIDKQQNVIIRSSSLIDQDQDFASSVAKGLESKPRALECRFLYDPKGSIIYEEITRQPEYYPTRTEERILKDCAHKIADSTGACTLIELGSGSSTKTNHLLSAYQQLYNKICYTPIDISSSALKDAGRVIIDRHPKVQVVGLHGTYSDSFSLIKCASPSLVIFLGSTIGNFTKDEEDAFWNDVSSNMQDGDYFLLGVDLIKDIDILEAAYNDQAGVTEKFTLNYFARMNRELGSDIDLDLLAHKAFYNDDEDRVEIYVEFLEEQNITIQPLEKTYQVKKGENILLEISRKFNLVKVQDNLSGYGLKPVKTYTDDRDWFGLILLKKRSIN